MKLSRATSQYTASGDRRRMPEGDLSERMNRALRRLQAFILPG
jgi:hypothetical protein